MAYGLKACSCHPLNNEKDMDRTQRTVTWITKLQHLQQYEGHSVNSEIRYVSAIAYLLAESWCCLYKAPIFISHNTKETIS